MSSLVREKMTFDDGVSKPVMLKSNRIFLSVGQGVSAERIAIRAQNMHVSLQLAAKVMFSYFKNGSFFTRASAYDWEVQWDSVLSGFERSYNPDIWASVYVNGACFFKTRDFPHLDVVEKCAMLNPDNYGAALELAVKGFKQAGRDLVIDHTSNIAATFSDRNDVMQCGVIHRGGGKNTVFNYTADGGTFDHRVVQGLMVTGAFLEALNLRYLAKGVLLKIKTQEIKQSDPEARKMRNAVARTQSLDKIISTFEKEYSVRYHPKKPELYYHD